MPQLGVEKIKKLVLPSSTEDDQAVVEIDTNITGGQAADLYGSLDEVQATFGILALAIRSWNFTDADGQPAPITVETVRKLSAKDFEFLSTELGEELNLKVSAQAVPKDEKKA